MCACVCLYIYIYIYIYIHAAPKSLQSCLTLCDPIDGSPPGSPIPGIVQARTLEWVAISFSNAWKWKVKAKLLSRVRLFETPWTAAYQAPPSMGFSRQESWSGVPLPSLIYIYITESLCCTLETNTTLQINYTSIKRKEIHLRCGVMMWQGYSEVSQVCREAISNLDLRHEGLPARSNVPMIMLWAIENTNVKDRIPAPYLVLHSSWLFSTKTTSQWSMIRYIPW